MLPFLGIQASHSFLKRRLATEINHKKVYKFVKRQNQTVLPREKKGNASGSGGSKSRADRPNEYWEIDMAKFMVESLGWCIWFWC